ncbi:MAG: hypothetical protein MUF09_12330 [Candidatus Nanopelagicales bacterium]|nr:hypothetical protein [Candidatus Nanopelagicales bacterium]
MSPVSGRGPDVAKPTAFRLRDVSAAFASVESPGIMGNLLLIHRQSCPASYWA